MCLLLVLVACEDPVPSEPTEDPPAETDAPNPEPEVVVPSEPELAFHVAERPAPFFLVDDISHATGATEDEALRLCRERARSGGPYQRRMSNCRRSMILAITPDDPIAFYRGCCWAVGETPEEARARCEERFAEGWCEPDDREIVVPIPGPYERPGRARLYEDTSVHRYLAPGQTEGSFEWVGESGEPPCFVAGTPIATMGGEVPIERIEPGDAVLTIRAGQLVAVPVIRVKQREAARVLAITVGDVTVRLTAEHPLRRGDDWVAAHELRVGDRVAVREGTAVVTDIAVEEGPHTVHALRVGAPHSYFAAGVLTHNY